MFLNGDAADPEALTNHAFSKVDDRSKTIRPDKSLVFCILYGCQVLTDPLSAPKLLGRWIETCPIRPHRGPFEHHTVPMIGRAHVARISNKHVDASASGRVWSVPCPNRLADAGMVEGSMLHLISTALQPQGVAVIIEARCMTTRNDATMPPRAATLAGIACCR